MAPSRLGLALGSGSARGWAHIGVLQALEARGIRADVVCGASVGSLVAAAYASGQLGALDDWVRELTRADVWRLVDTSLRGGGVMRGDRLMAAIAQRIHDRPIEQLPVAFAAVATDLETGHEVWLRRGSMLAAVRASSGLPGLFSPVRHEGRWLIDGGVVNPVPVSLCIALGAEEVIAVNLNAHLAEAHRRRENAPPSPGVPAGASADEEPVEEKPVASTTSERWSELVEGLREAFRSAPEEENAPGLFDVMGASINIMQDRITRSRMAGDPPSLVITPRLGHLKLMDFHRAAEAIAIGKAAVERLEDDLAPFAAR